MPSRPMRRLRRRMTAAGPDPHVRRLARCARLQQDRVLAGQYVGFSLCADPVWDMLLELYVASSCNYPLSLSSLGLAANVPPTTALRAIRTMERARLVIRTPDLRDGRRIHVLLTDMARTRIERMLDAMEQPARQHGFRLPRD